MATTTSMYKKILLVILDERELNEPGPEFQGHSSGGGRDRVCIYPGRRGGRGGENGTYNDDSYTKRIPQRVPWPPKFRNNYNDDGCVRNRDKERSNEWWGGAGMGKVMVIYRIIM